MSFTFRVSSFALWGSRFGARVSCFQLPVFGVPVGPFGGVSFRFPASRFGFLFYRGAVRRVCARGRGGGVGISDGGTGGWGIFFVGDGGARGWWLCARDGDWGGIRNQKLEIGWGIVLRCGGWGLFAEGGASVSGWGR